MSNWQPISTAPKDGTRVLLCTRAGSAVAWWDKRYKVWRIGFGLYTDRELCDEGFWQITHWQPLPDPPADNQENPGPQRGPASVGQIEA